MPNWVQIVPYFLEANPFQRCILQKKTLIRGWPAHGHDYIEIELFLSGSGTQWVNGVQISFHAGSLFLLSPKDYHRVEPDETADVVTIHIQPEILYSAGLPTVSNAYYELLPERLFQRCRDVLTELAKPSHMSLEYHETEILAVSLQLAVELIRNGASHPLGEHGKHLQRALKYIQDNWTDPGMNLKDAAAACGLSPTYFSKVFKDTIGCRYVDYVSQRRLHHACILLKTTSASVTEIAYEVGFSGQAHFFRCFKEAFHCTPAAYRKQEAAPSP